MKVQYVQINDKLKEYLRKIIVAVSEDSEEEIVYDTVGEILYLDTRENDYNLYKVIIGMLFADTVRILSYKNYYFEITQEERAFLKELVNYPDLASLFEAIDIGELNISSLLKGSVEFDRKTLYYQYLCYQASDMEYLAKFNPFMVFEFSDIVKPYELDEAVSEFSNTVRETETDIEVTEDSDKIVFYLKEKLLVLSQCNEEKCKKIMLEIIRHYYKLTMTYQKLDPENFLDEDKFLMGLIEEFELDEVIDCILHDAHLMNYIIRLYLESKSFGSDFSDEVIEDCFIKNTNNKVKKKLGVGGETHGF